MSGLLIRYDPDLGVLRSVGDPPNGILIVCAPQEGATWAVDGSYTPPTGISGSAVDPQPSDDGMGPNSTVVDVDDVAAGCESRTEALGLLEMVGMAAASSFALYAPQLQFEVIGSHCELAVATRDALERHGYLTRDEAT